MARSSFYFYITTILLSLFVLADVTSSPDFTAYIKATHIFIEGGNPYLANYSKNPFYQFYSPPYVFSILALLGWIDLVDTSFYHSIFLFSSIFISIMLINSIVKLQTRSYLANFIIALAIIPYGHILHGITWGTLSWIPLLGISISVWLWHKRCYTSSGISTFLLLLRPHQEILLLLYAFYQITINKYYKFFKGIIIALTFSLILILIINYKIIKYYAYAGSLLDIYSFASTTIVSISLYILNINMMTLLPASLLTIIIYVFRMKNIFILEPIYAISLLTPVSLLLSPYCWFHDYLIIIPTLIVYIKYSIINEDKLNYRIINISALMLYQITSFATAIYAGQREIHSVYYLPTLISMLPILIILHNRIIVNEDGSKLYRYSPVS